MPSRLLEGCRAIVTGASSGIGHAIALQLGQAGAELVVTARRESRLAQLGLEIASLGRKVVTIIGDITDAGLRQKLVDTAQRELGGLDLLVNNAGIGASGPFAAASGERMRKVMEVNFFAPVELTRIAVPLLRQGKQPLVCNIGSVLGHVAIPDASEYCASKFALRGFTESLRAELAAEGIDVLLVSPSTTDTEFFDQAIDNTAGKSVIANRAKMTPDAVAKQALRAIRSGKREVILSNGGKWLVWAGRWFPSLVAGRLARRK
jgi:short-subunit dehydrogenase